MRALLSGLILSLRYTVHTSGIEAIARGGTSGILFLPNHPALIDPVILMTALYRNFRPRALGDREQIDRFFVRNVARHLRAIEMPDLLRHGPAAREEVNAAIQACTEALQSGDNLVLYPVGHLQTSRLEKLGGVSAVSTLVANAPDCRVVLVRTTGLWGSRFSWAHGRRPKVAPVLLRGFAALIASGWLFLPRRQVSVELVEPSDFPREAPRDVQNRYLEAFYNQDPQPALKIPFTPWSRRGKQILPEPDLEWRSQGTRIIPEAVRRAVSKHLHDIAGVDDVDDDDRLSDDLAMDSLQRAELTLWLEDEFGAPRGDIDALITVADVLDIASGHVGAGATTDPLRTVPSGWFQTPTKLQQPAFFDGDDLVSALLAAATSAPNLPILADQTAGVRSYRQLLTGIAALQPALSRITSRRVGMMLPATVGADVVYLALLFAGKTPVMVNWTVGTRHALHGLETVHCEKVLTARALTSKLKTQGVDLGPLEDRLVFLEDLVAGLGPWDKIRAFVRARFRPQSLIQARSEDIAVILFTSGSESLPKAVPLTDDNLLSNLRDIFARVQFEPGDRLLSVLPPFHSFGLTAGVLMPLLGRIPTVHYPLPTDGAMLARMVEAYDVNLMGGTPTFLGGMVRGAAPGQIRGLRLIVSGGESFPESVRIALKEACPEAKVLEGYGITECSPIVAINAPGDARLGSVGRPLPSLCHLLVKPESTTPAPAGTRGELLVSGPSIFGGYLGVTGTSPFVEFDDRRWYRTGDLVREDADGFLFFEGRLKRFIKLGGEMVSLPAIEEALSLAFPCDEDSDGPAIAVEATSNDFSPEVVLFTTHDLSRADANRALRSAGLSPLHAVRRIVRCETLPVLGTGKVDHRSLQESLSISGTQEKLR